MSKKVIETKNLTKFYGKHRGIEDLTLEVSKGEIFGFIGPNGSGKSTTIRTLLSLIHKTSGEGYLFGKDTSIDKSVLKNVGYVPSEVFYYDDMTVIELLEYSASFYSGNYKKRIQYLAETMELDLKRKINELSFGNKKKVAIVAALLHSPKLLILDEPTTGLDPLMQKKFYNLLKEENEKGMTIFFSSHVLQEVQKICNRVGIIKEGKIVEISSIKTLKEEKYKKFIIEFNKKVNKNLFAIENVSDLKIEDKTHSFIYKGDVNNILSLIKEQTILDITIEEPSLEEIFMHYYGNE
ncbi:MAG: ABC transporter ATP-binding protein [Bacilli bacterium]|nr:ABC transporter ATP-binding protein [Bacilli bacterium]